MVYEARLAVPKGQDSESDKDAQPPPRKIFVIDLQNPAGKILGWLSGANIASSQYERDISFSFGDRARVVEVDVMEEHPPGIGSEPSVAGPHQEKLILAPILLNRGDWIRLKAVVENPISPVTANARILGIKDLRRRWGGLRLVGYGMIIAFLVGAALDTLPRWVGWFLTGDGSGSSCVV